MRLQSCHQSAKRLSICSFRLTCPAPNIHCGFCERCRDPGNVQMGVPQPSGSRRFIVARAMQALIKLRYGQQVWEQHADTQSEHNIITCDMASTPSHGVLLHCALGHLSQDAHCQTGNETWLHNTVSCVSTRPVDARLCSVQLLGKVLAIAR